MSRATELVVEALADQQTLASPGPGWFFPIAKNGAVVSAGDVLGELDVLGRRSVVLVPAGVRGVVSQLAIARVAVEFRSTLCNLASVSAGDAAAPADAAVNNAATGLLFLAPTSGRFYGRPGPGKDSFVVVGGRIRTGQPVCMLEVMKTFHRVAYGGAGLPAEATIVAVLVADEADVAAGQPLLQLEEITER